MSADTHSIHGPDDWFDPQHSRPSGKHPRFLKLRWFGGWLLATVAVCVGAAMGTDAFGHPADRRWIAAGVCVVVLAALIITGSRPPAGKRGRVWVPAAACFVAATFTLGAFNSVVIDGRPVPATSTEAKSHQLVLVISDDIKELTRIDELLGLDEAESRARNREYGPALAAAESMSARWARTEVASIPSGDLISPAQRMATASYAAVEALQRKEQLLGTSDPKTVAELNSYRQTLITETVAAGRELSEVAGTYGVSLDLGAPTVRE